MCFDDGPGIRTTVFFKGCPIRCPWCCNPENLNHEIESGVDGTVYGKMISEEELLAELLKDKHYFSNGGGVTFSGGECLLFLHKLIPLLKKLKQNNISIAIETSLFVPLDNLKTIIQYIDWLYVDFKILDKTKCFSALKGNLDLFISNLAFLRENDYITKVHPRIPLVSSLTDNNDNIFKIIDLFKKTGITSVEIFSAHNLAKEKYNNLRYDFFEVSRLSDERINDIAALFKKNNIAVTVLHV